jgi:catechol 2,3-dioxygenase-like lactoylglutathione lyase family enzyme
MNSEASNGGGVSKAAAKADMKLEVLIIPVTDVERAKAFYVKLGWRLDKTPPGLVQLTPPGSSCSILFGANLTKAAPGSAEGFVIVSDIAGARDALVAAGVKVGEIFHVEPSGPVSGPDPEHRSYFTRATVSDPDGNMWTLQEITQRLPGRVDTGVTSYGSVSDLASALRRAEAAHGEHEKRTGVRDANWADWYAEHMAAEQSGKGLPT